MVPGVIPAEHFQRAVGQEDQDAEAAQPVIEDDIAGQGAVQRLVDGRKFPGEEDAAEGTGSPVGEDPSQRKQRTRAHTEDHNA